MYSTLATLATVGLLIFFAVLSLACWAVPLHLFNKYGRSKSWNPFIGWAKRTTLPDKMELIGYPFFLLPSQFFMSCVLIFSLVSQATTAFQLGFSICYVLALMLPIYLTLFLFRLVSGPTEKKSTRGFIFVTSSFICFYTFGYILLFEYMLHVEDTYLGWADPTTDPLTTNTTPESLGWFAARPCTRPLSQYDFIIRLLPIYTAFLISLIGVLKDAIIRFEIAEMNKQPLTLSQFTFSLMLLYFYFGWASGYDAPGPVPLNHYPTISVQILVVLSQYAHLPHNHYLNTKLRANPYKDSAQILNNSIYSYAYSSVCVLMLYAQSEILNNHPEPIDIPVLNAIALVMLVSPIWTALVCFFRFNRRQEDVEYSELRRHLVGGAISSTGLAIVMKVTFSFKLVGDWVILASGIYCLLFTSICILTERKYGRRRANINILNVMVHTRYKWDTKVIDSMLDLDPHVPKWQNYLGFTIRDFFRRAELFGMTKRQFCGYVLDKWLVFTPKGKLLWKKAQLLMTKDEDSVVVMLPSDITRLFLKWLIEQEARKLPPVIWFFQKEKLN